MFSTKWRDDNFFFLRIMFSHKSHFLVENFSQELDENKCDEANITQNYSTRNHPSNTHKKLLFKPLSLSLFSSLK